MIVVWTGRGCLGQLSMSVVVTEIKNSDDRVAGVKVIGKEMMGFESKEGKRHRVLSVHFGGFLLFVF